MSEPMSTPQSRCPWCSAPLPDPSAEKCPSCGAQLVSTSGSEPSLPGVTALDPEAIIRARADARRSRGGIMGFLTGGDLADLDGPVPVGSLAPPEVAVRREMLRLQHEAEQADAVAETIALRADVLAERGLHVDQLNASGGGGEGEDAAEAEAPAAPTPAAGAPATDGSEPPRAPGGGGDGPA